MLPSKFQARRNQYMQLLAENIKTPRALSVMESDDTTKIRFYDIIDPYFGIGAEQFVGVLDQVQTPNIDIFLNSPGGDVFEARTMRTELQRHAANVRFHIDFAASAATFLSTAGDEIEITKGGFYMIHNAWTFGYGNRHEFTELAGFLGMVDETIVDDYASLIGEDKKEQLATWMDAETWFTAQQAVEHGFAHSIYTGDGEAAANNTARRWALNAYSNVPERLKAAAEKPDPKETALYAARRANLLRKVELLERIG
jgi:ATP-dependent Clp protease, protease subunit